MDFNVGIVRGATKKEIMSKKFNIYLGISLGNKWFVKSNLRKHLQFALKYTQNKVGLLVADTLHAINYEVRNRISYDKARRRSIKKGDEIIKMLNELIKELPEKDRKKVEIIRWDDVKKDLVYKQTIGIAKEEFENNGKFRDAILKIIKNYTSREKKTFSEKELIRLGEYIVEELPEVVNGFMFKNIYYNCYLYPYDGDLTKFVENLQKHKIFPKLSKKIVRKHNIFVELG